MTRPCTTWSDTKSCKMPVVGDRKACAAFDIGMHRCANGCGGSHHWNAQWAGVLTICVERCSHRPKLAICGRGLIANDKRLPRRSIVSVASRTTQHTLCTSLTTSPQELLAPSCITCFPKLEWRVSVARSSSPSGPVRATT
eukprot:224039-Prymnesium_polylepis.3